MFASTVLAQLGALFILKERYIFVCVMISLTCDRWKSERLQGRFEWHADYNGQFWGSDRTTSSSRPLLLFRTPSFPPLVFSLVVLNSVMGESGWKRLSLACVGLPQQPVEVGLVEEC